MEEKQEKQIEIVAATEVPSTELGKQALESKFDNEVALANLSKQLDEMQAILTKSYLQDLSTANIVPYSEEYPKWKERGLRWFHIDRIVYEEGTFFVDKFAMLLSALHAEARELVLVLHKEGGGRVQLYLGASDRDDSKMYYAAETLRASLEGVFPGIHCDQEKPDTFINLDKKSVSAVSVVASLRDEHKENFAQGLERLINATAKINDFTAMMVAESISEGERLSIVDGYAQMYSTLAPLASVQKTMSRDQSTSLTEGESESLSHTLTEGVSRTIAHGTTSSESATETYGTSTSLSKGTSTGTSNSRALTGGISLGLVVNLSKTKTTTKTTTETSTEGVNESTSSAVSSGTSRTTTDGSSESTSKGNTTSTNTSESRTRGEGESMTITQENKAVSNLLKKIDEQINRIDTKGALGMWNSATYFIAPTTTDSKKLASIYKGCVLGDESNYEVAAINTWRKEEQAEVAALAPYLKNYVHPRFLIGQGYNVSAGSLVNSQDLAIHMALPQSSVTGVLVQERTAFGREVFVDQQMKRPFKLGHTYHLGLEEPTTIELDASSFSKHVFVTGSTGSGKSNTIYHLLDALMNPLDPEDAVKVLVVEPAKGEYKHILTDAKVYGTNPCLNSLLRVNPFAFPEHIRVDEHVDRLVEIFNVCWPMYAAMPAVLKDAVLRAYEACGWDMMASRPRIPSLFPTFADVLHELNIVIRSSAYSADTKGDYIGALETRLRSLTNGINAHIFSNSNCVSDADLFDENVVVDLSRIGSSETRSLIMGVLMLKLSEYRMAQSAGKMNQPLRHVTVLEEAHNLLKRTSKEQSAESSNLQGKSVEMIAHSIAEMRTYGEGFIIADQSPTSLDEAAIKNTNTKIIMSLPDGDDRRIAGKAVGLTDKQIDEIARMPVGVGVVFQNNWSEAVMCKILEYECPDGMRQDEPETLLHSDEIDLDIVTLLLSPKEKRANLEQLEERILSASLRSTDKLQMLEILKDYQLMDRKAFADKWPARVRALILSAYLKVDQKVEALTKEFGKLKNDALFNKLLSLVPEILKKNDFNSMHVVDYLLLAETSRSSNANKLYQTWARALKSNRLC